MFACFDWLNSENTEWEFFALFDLWSETRLIKYEGIEAPAERPPQFYNAKKRGQSNMKESKRQLRDHS